MTIASWEGGTRTNRNMELFPNGDLEDDVSFPLGGVQLLYQLSGE